MVASRSRAISRPGRVLEQRRRRGRHPRPSPHRPADLGGPVVRRPDRDPGGRRRRAHPDRGRDRGARRAPDLARGSPSSRPTVGPPASSSTPGSRARWSTWPPTSTTWRRTAGGQARAADGRPARRGPRRTGPGAGRRRARGTVDAAPGGGGPHRGRRRPPGGGGRAAATRGRRRDRPARVRLPDAAGERAAADHRTRLAAPPDPRAERGPPDAPFCKGHTRFCTAPERSPERPARDSPEDPSP